MTFQVFGAIEKLVANANATADDPWAFQYFNTNATGSGPFVLEKLEPETEIELVTDPPTSGRWCWSAVRSTSPKGLVYLGMNQTIAPLDNGDFRRVIVETVSYQALLDQAMYG